jgi:histidinol-phosphate phosphatase family protein
VNAPARYAVVVPTVGRWSLVTLLTALARQAGPLPEEVVVVDDRPEPDGSPVATGPWPFPLHVLNGWGRGPAAARNRGWQVTRAPWVAFLDDDVVPRPGWARELVADLDALGPADGASAGRIHVPLPSHRAPTDWERSTAGLESARWATADMAYRRTALEQVGGFDERFPRAYREDADLALRVQAAGWGLQRGRRVVDHPVRPAGRACSVKAQRGNADDSLMRALHGPAWRELAGTGRGLFRRHLVAASGAVVAVAASPFVGRVPLARRLAAAGLTAYGLHVADLVRRRVAPGPRTPDEVVTMSWTSAVLPLVAVWHRARGWWRHRSAEAWPLSPRAVLLDRDGTLVHGVPYNGDPDAVQPVPGAREALDRLRDVGLRIGVVTNQSGVARGLLTRQQVDAVNAAVEARLGPIGTWQVCPHGAADRCSCRKPRPGLVHAAARTLGVRAEECVVIGDIRADMEAARAAGARSVLVPAPATRAEELTVAPVVAADLGRAVDVVLGWRRG